MLSLSSGRDVEAHPVVSRPIEGRISVLVAECDEKRLEFFRVWGRGLDRVEKRVERLLLGALTEKSAVVLPPEGRDLRFFSGLSRLTLRKVSEMRSSPKARSANVFSDCARRSRRISCVIRRLVSGPNLLDREKRLTKNEQ